MTTRINAPDFNLAATLECGQAFRWSRGADGWYTGIVGNRVQRVRQLGNFLEGDVDRLYFSLDRDLHKIVATFPDTPHLREAVQRHWGLRILRQKPWETLASFIASSTKQIVQIRQIVAHLAQRFGEPLAVGRARSPSAPPVIANNAAVSEKPPYHSFPSVDTIARATLPELLACKLGFRAKYLLAAARRIGRGEIRLEALPAMEYGRALEELLKLDGVGEKIANCTLLFSCGHDEAFPVDVWMKRALQRIGSRRLQPALSPRTLKGAATEAPRSYFGPYAGWAQQYLFYNERNLLQAHRVVVCADSTQRRHGRRQDHDLHAHDARHSHRIDPQPPDHGQGR
jgi:N-glycosylase/DNA lyase